MAEEEYETQVLYCPHCGNKSVQTVLLTQEYLEKFYSVSDGSESTEEALYTVARCETCSEILVYSAPLGLFDDSEYWGVLAFPRLSSFTDAVPGTVRRVYTEASLVKNLSPTAFVILARRVLEEICRERGVSSRNLVESLSKLAEDNIIPSTLSEATTLIRLVGNAGAHASDVQITMIQVWAIDDFIKAIIEYIYVAPKKIEEFKRRFAHFAD